MNENRRKAMVRARLLAERMKQGQHKNRAFGGVERGSTDSADSRPNRIDRLEETVEGLIDLVTDLIKRE